MMRCRSAREIRVSGLTNQTSSMTSIGIVFAGSCTGLDLPSVVPQPPQNRSCFVLTKPHLQAGDNARPQAPQ